MKGQPYTASGCNAGDSCEGGTIINSVEQENSDVDEVSSKHDDILEQNELAEYCAETASHIHFKLALREKNVASNENILDESFYKKLDSSLKKNTAFVKRLKNLTESQKEQALKDCKTLNLTKYISEVASAIVEAKPKMSDVSCFLETSSEIHQRYIDFAPSLMQCWHKMYTFKKDEKPTNLSKLRVDLRLISDLTICGVLQESESLHLLQNCLEHLLNIDRQDHNYLSTIISFCKMCGENLDEFVPKKFKMLASKYNVLLPKSNVYTQDKIKGIIKVIYDYFASACTHLIAEHANLQTISQYNKKILRNRGELPQDRQDIYQKAKDSVQKIQLSTQALADLVCKELPELPEEIEPKEEVINIDVYNAFSGDDSAFDSDSALWEDEDSKEFYENFKDLKAILPGILFKESEKLGEDDREGSGEAGEVDVMLAETEDDLKQLKISEDGSKMEEGDDGDNTTIDEDFMNDRNEVVDDDDATPLPPDIEDDIDMGSAMRHIMDTFIQGLTNCVNRERIDRAAEDFCLNMNTKVNRRKLARALYLVPRTRLDLLPFYSRLVATLHPCMPDISTELCNMLKSEFRWHIRKKDQVKLESKIKTVRFLAELTKFNLFPKSEALNCFRQLLLEFKHHNIDMACNFLETCGRYLYRSPTSHARTRILLEQMMRKKTVQHMDSRYITMIENAYYYCNPPKMERVREEENLPMELLYMRKLICVDLNEDTTEIVLRQLKKFPLREEYVRTFLVKSLCEVWKLHYYNIEHVASIIAGLIPVMPSLIEVVYSVIEDIRIGMESNHPKFNQRRVCQVKFLGELYNYRMADSQLIFKTLYTLIMFGVSLNPLIPSPLDPPHHLFRIKLVCTLLETCGQFFEKGSARVKLDCFLKYFLRYWWFKRSQTVWTDETPFPVIVNHMVYDVFTELRPNMNTFQSFTEAAVAVKDMERELAAKYNIIIDDQASGDAAQTGNDSNALKAIDEADEMEMQNSSSGDEDDESDDAEGSSGQEDKPNRSRRTNQSKDDDEVEEDEVDDDGEDGDEDGEDMESHTSNSALPKYVSCEEDDSFQKELEQIMSSSLAQQSQLAAKPVAIDIAVPQHLRASKKQASGADVSLPGLGKEMDEGDEAGGESEEDTASINFIMITKKGNKPQYKTLKVPAESSLAANLRHREAAERAEKQRVKELTLNINERQEEEEREEMMAAMQRPLPTAAIYVKKPEFRPQKGTPDVDKIFGHWKK